MLKSWDFASMLGLANMKWHSGSHVNRPSIISSRTNCVFRIQGEVGKLEKVTI